MKKRTNKGFTLTELIIVVVIIGILAAVLIPTLTACVKKAKISNDKQLVRNLNLALSSDTKVLERGGQHLHMQEALEAAAAAGYDVGKINATKADNEILWDSENDVFCYLNDDKIEYIPSSAKRELSADNDADCILLWQILKVENSGDKGYADLTEKQFSVYAKEESTAKAVKTNKGFDAGTYKGIESVEFTRTTAAGNDVVIRTNGGTLTIDAENDTVKHYGDANVLVIDAIHTSSYHEYGRINNAQIKKGRIVIENNEASIDNLLLIAKEDKSGFEDIVVQTKENADLPTFDRTDVDIAPNGTLVLNVVTPSTDEFVYLTKAGVIEQVVVTNEKVNTETVNVTTVETAKNASETSEKTFAVAEQVANIGTKNDQGKYLDTNNNPVELEDLNSASQIQIEEKAGNEAAETGTKKFAGGVGTLKSPYLISNANELSNIRDCLDAYYVLVNDIDMRGVSNWTPIGSDSDPFAGKFDGMNYSITNWTTNHSLFGIIRGIENTKLTGVLSDVIDENYELKTNNTSENNYTAVLKNLNFEKCRILINEPDFGVIADGVFNAYVEKCEFSDCEIDYGPTYRTGIMFGGVYSCHIKDLHLSEDNVITNSSSINDYWGNNGLLIGGAKYYNKPYQNIIEGCINDASANLNTGTVDYGYFGGIIGFIEASSTSTLPYPIIINCVNNGDLEINNQRQYISLSGICGADAGGSTSYFIKCINNGDLTVLGNNMPVSGAYGEISGICSYSNGNFIKCYNNGSLDGNANYVAGLSGSTSSNTTLLGEIKDCANNGTLISNYPGACIGDFYGYISSSVGVKVQGSEINSLNINPYKIILQNAGSSSGTLIVPEYTGIISVSESLGFNAIDLSKTNGKLELIVNNINVTLLGNNPNASLIVKGTNNTITVASSSNLGDIRLEGAGNKIINNGTINHLSIKDSSVESINNSEVGSVEFIGSDNLNMVFTNNGIISNNDGKWHTVQTQSLITLTFNNNGKIYGNGQKYALLFYGLSDVVFNAGPESQMIIENPAYTAVFHNSESMRADTVMFNIEDGAEGVNENQYYGIATHQTGETQVTVKIITQIEVSMTWKSGMPNSGHRSIGETWDSFYVGADGYTCSTYGISYDPTRQYTIKINDDYDDSIDFTLTIVFYNSQTGLITDIKTPGDVYSLYGGYHLAHGQSFDISQAAEGSDGFYITGFCGTKHTSGYDPVHQEHIATFQNNITLFSEKITNE